MNTPEQDYEIIKPVVSKIEEKDFLSINFPYRYYLQEVVNVYVRIEKYRKGLEAAGMKFGELDTIPTISGASRLKHSTSIMLKFPRAESRIKWEAKREEGEYLLYDLLCTFDLVFHDYPDLQGMVSTIRQGSSNADFIQDLMDASILGRENSSYLEAINYDMANIDRAAILSKELSLLLAEAIADNSTSPEMRIEREQCFTYMKKTIDTGMRLARYYFRNDKDIAKKFIIPAPKRYTVKETPEPVAA